MSAAEDRASIPIDRLAAAVQRAVEEAPPLTPEAIAQLVQLLNAGHDHNKLDGHDETHRGAA